MSIRSPRPRRAPSRRLLLALLAAAIVPSARLTAQTTTDASARETPPFPRHFVGSSAFMVFNLLPDPPSFFQLNYGYRLTPNDVISVEAITWKYTAPLGIPYGPSYGAEEEEYPGAAQGFGVGVAYQRFWWKQLYSSLHALPLLQRYTDENNQHIQNGFQLFMTARAGYQVRLFSDRWFIEPSVAFTAWPINTNVPDNFAVLDRKWSKYFLFEPGLHVGRRF